MAQLVKAPLLFLSALAFQIATTPPHPPPKPTERVPLDRLEDFLRMSSPRIWVHLCIWAITLIEIVIHTISFIKNPEIAWMLDYLQINDEQNTLQCTPLFLFGVVLTFAGAYLRWQSYRALGPFFTFELSMKKDHRLIKDGPYRVVRHPGYLGILIVLAGAIVVYASPGSWIWESGVLDTRVGKTLVALVAVFPLVITAALMNRLPREDEVLHQTFGEEWERWAKEVPHKLIPLVY